MQERANLEELYSTGGIKGFSSVRLPKVARKKIKVVKYDDYVGGLPDWSVKRQRFRPHGIDVYLVSDNHAKNIAYSFYRHILIVTNNGDLIEKYNLDNLMDGDGVKQLSDYMKKKGEQAESRWRYLVDLNRLNDYVEPAGIEPFTEEIKDWVTRKPIHRYDGDEEKWYQEFRTSCRKVLRRSGKRPDRIVPVDEFIKNIDIWCTSGSGYEPELKEKITVYDKVKDRWVKPMKTKWVLGWHLTRYKLKRLLFKRRKQYCKAIPKSEAAKVRAVISSDMSLYLKMSYISTFLDKWFHGREESTLWMTSEQRFNLWQKFAPDGTYRMPLDQSEFDRNVTMRQVSVMLEEIKALLVDMHVGDVMLEVMDLIIYALDGGNVFVGDTVVPISNGILSGWRWTAMLGTICNLTLADMAIHWAGDHGFVCDLIELNAQGDDDWTKFKDYPSALVFWLAYKEFGLGVNPNKFFLSTTRDEYLRRVLDKGIITGYPARSVLSLLFRNPVNEKEPEGSARARSGLNKWKLFCERMDCEFDGSYFKRCWIQDCIGMDKDMTKDLLEEWFNASVLQKGIGWEDRGQSIKLIPTAPDVSTDVMDLDSLAGYREWLTEAVSIGVRPDDAYTFVINTLNFKNDVRLPKWVKYIYSHDDIRTSVPVGLSVSEYGTVALGVQAWSMANRKNWRWFRDYKTLKTATQYLGYTWEKPPLLDVYSEVRDVQVLRRSAINLRVKEGISPALARLSEKPELVYDHFDSERWRNVPRRWYTDMIRGRLKSRVPVYSGWGSDVVGHVGQSLLNGACVDFLSHSRPTMRMWNSLLRDINIKVRQILEGLAVRVVE